MKRILFLSLTVLSFALICHPTPIFAGKKKISEIDSTLHQEKSEMEVLKKRIEKQDKTLSRVGAKETSLLKTMRHLEDKLKMKERELKIYKWNIEKNKTRISQLTRNIQAAEQQLGRQKAVLGKRLRAIYKEGGMFPIKVLFSADNFNDLLQRIKYMETIAAHDSSLFQKYDDRLKNLEQEKGALLRARTRLLRFEEDALEKQKEIQGQKSKKTNFLKKLKKEKKLNQQIRKELLRSSENLNSLIARLEEKLILGQELDIVDKKGRLQMPVKGRVLNKFGKKRDKQYATYIVYNGINVSARKGTPVQAVFGGKVLYADALEGYGNLIILGHSKEYHSLYGHLDEITAKVGKVVRTGQVIGLSGDTGSLQGETLYFELRHKGKPIDPAGWFLVTKR